MIIDFQATAQVLPDPVPPEWRGTIDAERDGHHDANLIRTSFSKLWNGRRLSC